MFEYLSISDSRLRSEGHVPACWARLDPEPGRRVDREGRPPVSRRLRSPTAQAVRVTVHESGAPSGFRWNGRHYEVQAVLASWVEATSWWRELGSAGSNGRAAHRDVWRVEAVSRTGTSGVYDLAVVADAWRLLRISD
jgi:hypothetical protein